MKKAYLVLGLFLLVLVLSACGRTNDKNISAELQNSNQEQVVLENTLNISKEYSSLRYRTDNVLINAKVYANYDNWNNALLSIVDDWKVLEKNASDLKKLADEISEETVSLKFVKTAQAYTKEEVSSVIDSAPMGKKISTLAKHLGVDAKMAQLILNETQNMISREAYGEEGDVFQTCENQAIVIKNASKVTVFVGTIALTGGTAAIATGGTLAQAAVVVSGADLTLEVTDDAAKMALGNNNKVSAIVGDVRKITEPAAAILMVSTLPNNLVKGIDKLNAVVFGADQLNGTIQSGSVVGIKLPIPTKEKPEPKTEISILEKEEVDTWMKEQGVSGEVGTEEDIEKILDIKQVESLGVDSGKAEQEEGDMSDTKDTQAKDNNDSSSEIVGVWEGILTHTPNQTDGEKQTGFIISLNIDGTVDPSGNGKRFATWEKTGSVVKLYYKDSPERAYYEFSLSGNILTFVKLAGPNSEGEWQENYAGEDFFGGKFYQIILEKQ